MKISFVGLTAALQDYSKKWETGFLNHLIYTEPSAVHEFKIFYQDIQPKIPQDEILLNEQKTCQLLTWLAENSDAEEPVKGLYLNVSNLFSNSIIRSSKYLVKTGLLLPRFCETPLLNDWVVADCLYLLASMNALNIDTLTILEAYSDIYEFRRILTDIQKSSHISSYENILSILASQSPTETLIALTKLYANFVPLSLGSIVRTALINSARPNDIAEAILRLKQQRITQSSFVNAVALAQNPIDLAEQFVALNTQQILSTTYEAVAKHMSPRHLTQAFIKCHDAKILIVTKDSLAAHAVPFQLAQAFVAFYEYKPKLFVPELVKNLEQSATPLVLAQAYITLDKHNMFCEPHITTLQQFHSPLIAAEIFVLLGDKINLFKEKIRKHPSGTQNLLQATYLLKKIDMLKAEEYTKFLEAPDPYLCARLCSELKERKLSSYQEKFFNHPNALHLVTVACSASDMDLMTKENLDSILQSTQPQNLLTVLQKYSKEIWFTPSVRLAFTVCESSLTTLGNFFENAHELKILNDDFVSSVSSTFLELHKKGQEKNGSIVPQSIFKPSSKLPEAKPAESTLPNEAAVESRRLANGSSVTL